MNNIITRYIRFFETLSPETLDSLRWLLAEDAVFSDPFNKAKGPDEIMTVFRHMFDKCRDPSFTVNEATGHDDVFYLRWIFEFGAADNRRKIEGISRVSVNERGQITEHSDYWDPAKQLYETIPVLGALFRKLRMALSATDRC